MNLISFDQLERLRNLANHPAALADLNQLLQGVAGYAEQGISPETYICMMEMQLDFLAAMRRFKAAMCEAHPNCTLQQNIGSIGRVAGFALAKLMQNDPLPCRGWVDALAREAADGLATYFTNYASVMKPVALPKPTHSSNDILH